MQLNVQERNKLDAFYEHLIDLTGTSPTFWKSGRKMHMQIEKVGQTRNMVICFILLYMEDSMTIFFCQGVKYSLKGGTGAQVV